MMDHKQAYRQLNRHEATLQISRTKAREEVFQYRELNANAAKQRLDNYMPLPKAPIKRIMKNPWAEIKTLDDLAEWCAMAKGELQNTLLGVSRDLPTSQTTSITISVSVVSTMQNTFGTMQLQFCWRPLNAMSKQFIWFVALGPWGGESISHREMMHCFSGLGRVRMATLTGSWDAVPHSWSAFSSSRMQNRAFKGFLPWFSHLQHGRYIRLLVWWSSRRGINLRCNPCTMEATVVILFSA